MKRGRGTFRYPCRCQDAAPDEYTVGNTVGSVAQHTELRKFNAFSLASYK